MSRMMGGRSPAGTATAKGLFPSLGTMPPQGAMTGFVMVSVIPIMWCGTAMAAM
ncbi:MAG TPA: hypothetical protein VEU07_14815 [Candidatus Acidoferrum sp.]|nr:hypothetical protein [Candidatus Acidoferrum sp.]